MGWFCRVHSQGMKNKTLFALSPYIAISTFRNSKKPKEPNSIPKNGNDLHSSNEICIYDPMRATWRYRKTIGRSPPRTLCPSGCVGNNELFVFGGQHGYPEDDGELFQEGNTTLLFRYFWRSSIVLVAILTFL